MSQVLAKLVTQLSVEGGEFKKDMVKAAKSTEKYKKSADKASTASKKMSEGFKRAANSSAILTGPLNGVSGRLSSLAAGFGAVGVAGTAVALSVAAFAATIKASIQVFKDYEQGQLKTAALLKATGSASGKTAAQIEELSRVTALNTLASVEGVRSASQVLLTFKSVQGDVFNKTIELSQDLAEVMGTDIKAAALQLGKALEDPKVGLTALKRSGVSFTESQKDMISTMVDAGETAKAQTYILSMLEKQIGGAGNAAAGGLSGSIDTLSQSWREFLNTFSETTGAGESAKSFYNTMSSGLNVATGLMDSASNDSLAGLIVELRELRAEKEKLDKGGEGIFDFLDQNLPDKLLVVPDELKTDFKIKFNDDEIARVTAEIKAITNITEVERKKQLQAQQAAEQTRIATEQERKNAELTAAKEKADLLVIVEQEKSAKLFNVMNKRFSNEAEKIDQAWQQRKEQINNFNLSEQEIKKAGFDSLLELQTEYHFLNFEQRDQALAVIAEKNRQEIDQEKAKQLEITENEIAEKKKRANAEQQIGSQINSMKVDLASQGLAIIARGAKEGSKLQKIAFIAQKGMAIAQAYINTEAAAIAAMALPPIGLGPVQGAPYSAVIRGLGYASIGVMAAQSIAGFEGGGYIPDAPRIGGLDGRGGKLAVLHPDESIYDHRKGQGNQTSEQPINIYLNIPDTGNYNATEQWYEDNRDGIVGDIRQALQEV